MPLFNNIKHQKETIDDFSIERTKRTEAYNMKSNHFHDGYEIYYMFKGERFYFIKDRTYHVRAGDLVLINMYDMHKTTEAYSPSHERLLINFRPDYIQTMTNGMEEKFYEIFQTFPVLRLNVREQGSLESILRKMIKEYEDKKEGYQTYLKLLLVELLLYIYRHIKKNKIKPMEYHNSLHEKVSEIVRYINNHYMDLLTLHSLSKQFHISPYYLSRIYKKGTGFSFVEYLNQVRINEAQKLLKTTSLSVTSIAEKVGYENPTHFGRVFKKVTGISPLKYRKTFL
ncbi:AraC family transcriptional regulator [Priestia megaterium]|jgi:YesN/AraC family two-component response regulator|nr:AraC family transcriptional regulator [Priestia megaterium]PGR14306.1 AraC family transcriptional regulator [Priestia megaterium]